MKKLFQTGDLDIFTISLFIPLIFFCEAFVMVLVLWLLRVGFWTAVLLDSCFLVILLSPGFYFLLYRPMSQQIRERRGVLDALREQEKRYRLMMEAMHDPVYICSLDYRVMYMNPAMIKRTGRNAIGELCYEVIHHREKICSWCVNHKIQRGEYVEYEVESPADGRFYNVAQCPIFYLDGRIDKMVILRDFTRYKQVEETLQWEVEINRTTAQLSRALLSRHSVEEISSLVLKAAKRLTESSLGYAGYIEEATEYLVCPTFTQDVWDECGLEDKQIIFKEFTGLWGWVLNNKRSLISNCVDEDPRSTGIPNGHVPVRQFLSSPALIGEKLVGQIALSNPKKDYDQRELKLIEGLADLYAIAIQNFRIEERLRRSRDELERRVEERTVTLKETNIKLSKEISDHKAAEDALQRSEKQLRRLSSQLLNFQEDERKRIAMELHDGIGQTLSAVKFKVETGMKALEEKGPQALLLVLGSVVLMVQEAVEEVRRICKNLRPPILDDLGIVATISWFCREFMNVYGTIQVEKEILLKEEEVPHEFKTPIFRVLQEALNNAAKHSQADKVHVVLRKKAGGVYLLIEDNGRGFDVKSNLKANKGASSGMGLASMRERATLSGGTFGVESSPGRGTRIVMSFPLPGDQRSTSPLSMA
ncbi:MAG: GAF domain-containing protein [Deltaproteobacteria bacterium]|nr:GAF domain-containing protein [Deltaproteobacteria bacterium]